MRGLARPVAVAVALLVGVPAPGQEREEEPAIVDAFDVGIGGPLVLDPVKRRIVELAPEIDPRELVTRFDLQKPRFVSIPDSVGGGTVVSFPANSLLWDELQPTLCGPGSGVRGCEDDVCKEFQLPAAPGGVQAAPPEPSAPEGGAAVRGRVVRADGTPLPDSTVMLVPEAPPIESLFDELEPYDWAGAIAGGPSPAANPARERLIEWTPSKGSFASTDALGRFAVRVDYNWSENVELVAGAGWESMSTRVPTPRVQSAPDDADDPRDTPPPEMYGEESDDPRVGILLVRSDDGWLPRFGNSTTVVARIYEPRGGAWVPSERERVIRVEFVERSSEEGRCLNADLPSDPQDSPDLYFPAGDNPDLTCSDDPSGKGYLFGTCVTKKPRSIQELTVGSQDFGSFSKLRASCADCVPLRHPIEGMSFAGIPALALEADVGKEEDLARVPKDDNDNQIADLWVWDLLDRPGAEDDADATPEGNGVAGDGLSAYEEYRGFLVRAAHQRTGPRRKDLFVDNRDGLPMGLFAEASQLAVWDVSEDELEDRVINFNSGHANVVEQHGLLLRDRQLSGTVVGYADMGLFDGLVGRMGPPKWVEEVKVDRAEFTGVFAGRLPKTVAHELGHAVGAHHHGNSFFGPTGRTVTSNPELTTAEKTILGDVEYPGPRLCEEPLPAEIDFWDKHLQTSGVENCVMRYRGWMVAYFQADGSIDCEPWPPERKIFCSSPAGTSFNGGNRTAGNAARGNCERSIQVNDR